jgi:hypothetical protein
MLEMMRLWMGWDEGISEKAMRMRSYHFWDQLKKMSPQPLICKGTPGAEEDLRSALWQMLCRNGS